MGFNIVPHTVNVAGIPCFKTYRKLLNCRVVQSDNSPSHYHDNSGAEQLISCKLSPNSPTLNSPTV